MLRAEAARDLHDAQLMRDVEVGGRLVEEEEARLLAECHGEKDALPLAPREGMHLALCERRDVRHLHRPCDCIAVCRARAQGEPPRMGKSAVGDELAHGEPRCRRALLRQDGAYACQLPRRIAVQLAPRQLDGPRIVRVQSREGAQEGGLARAVGSDDRRAPPRRDLDVHAVQDLPSGGGDGEPRRPQYGAHSCLRRR